MALFLPASAVPGVYYQGRFYRHAPSPIKKKGLKDKILLKIHRGQHAPFYSKARFRTVVAGRRWGKTHWVSIELLMAAAAKPKQKCWYVAPTFAMAKQIAWQKLKEIIPEDWILKIWENSLTILLKNGSTIELKGADRPDSVRGVGVHFLVLDEFQDMKKELWTAIRPVLTDTSGRCIFIGTPKSYNHLYEMYDRGQLNSNGKKNPQWESWQFPTSSSPFIAAEEIESARGDLDRAECA